MRNILAVIILLFSAPAWAQIPLSVDLAEDHIDITTGFNGSHLVVYGTKSVDGAVAVILRGPKKDVVVRRKDQLFGAWINKAWVKFKDVPQLYDLALSENALDTISEEVLREEQIGLAALKLEADRDNGLFRDALVRNKQAEGLFPQTPQPIKMLSDNFFRAEFYVPPHVPTGDYTVETYMIEDGRILDQRLMNVRVAQVGFGAFIYNFAHAHYFAYSFVTILIAVFAGWLSNAIRIKA